jgi:hypothetical protein
MVTRRALTAVAVSALLGAGAAAFSAGPLPATASTGGSANLAASVPFFQDPLGPLVDVTSDWQHYQPTSDFCVKPDVAEVPPDTAPTLTGSSPACAASQFASGDTGLVEIHVTAPPLCATCRRLFIDYSRIGPNAAPIVTAHGHVYFRPMSFNPGYTVGIAAHSPNVKNLTNDALVAPPTSPIPSVLSLLDVHAMAYTGDTAHTAHIAAQGPYYVGPWYLNAQGRRITGAYLDLELGGAAQLHAATLDGVVYAAGFGTDPSRCPDTLLLGAAYTDGNYLYGGCVNWFGASALPGIDPWTGG